MKRSLRVATAVLLSVSAVLSGQASRQTDWTARARSVLAQHSGSIVVQGLREPVEVLRDTWGIPHIYARNTEDLFFAQGYVVAQDRMWQLEMWRRNGEGLLAEVLGSEYVTRDRFARLLAFRGNWDDEFQKYHPEGRKIFDAFAAGINRAIERAIDEDRIPVEFQLMGFRPQPHWTAKTLLTRMPGWTLSRNVSSEVNRSIAIRNMGVTKVEELSPTDPARKIEVPAGLRLEDIVPQILDLTRDANNLRFQVRADLGSNNWVVGGEKSATGKPILANDPHREVVNPALRYVVHLNAPGWNAIGATEPGLPGISIGHNDRLGWGFTILGMDQEDLYVEETDPANPNRYLWKGEWRDMRVERQLLYVQGEARPREIEMKFTHHGPVLHEDPSKQRAYAMRWVGAEVGGAGYIGSLNVMQAKDWNDFNARLARAWYIPTHSLVYADVDGNIGYRGVGLTPIRSGWDGLLPVPGKDGQYEWSGFVPFDQLPLSFNTPRHYYASANNDVVPKIVPDYKIPLGYEYSAPFRFNRITEALSANRRFSVRDMELLQSDALSIPARELVPLLKNLKSGDADVQRAVRQLLEWNFVLDRDSTAATIYEYWMVKLPRLVYQSRIPDAHRASFRDFNIMRAVEWAKLPDSLPVLEQALREAIADLKTKSTAWDQIKWGDLHTAALTHPLGSTAATRDLFAVTAPRRSGDAYTVLASTSASETNTRQLSGASFKMVLDTADWDRSTGLSVPGNSAQPLSPHYADLTPMWGEGQYFPLAFTRKAVETHTKNRVTLTPLTSTPLAGDTLGPDRSTPAFTPIQPEMFGAPGSLVNAFADYDGDGDLDLYVGFMRGQLNRLYRNNGRGQFEDVASSLGIADSDEVRAASWGDFDSDGDPDLYLGFVPGSTVRNRLYRNDGHRFVDVAREHSVDLAGATRQVSWVDYDSDDDVDLFVAFRDQPNRLFRNDSGKLTDVSTSVGLADPRKSVGGTWFDFDEDGDLDLVMANQEGDANAFFRNDGSRFVDVAVEMKTDGAGRSRLYGSVGACVTDYNADGRMDLFLANYGPNALYRNDGKGRFTDVAADTGLSVDRHTVACAFGDYDNDGRVDLYLSGYVNGIVNYRDYLFRNLGSRFADVTPANILKNDADHGVQWADIDGDGDLDLSLTDGDRRGTHFLFRNDLASPAGARSVQVLVLNARGHFTKPGTEVRVFRAGTREVIGSGIVDTGSGYNSQNATPVHIGTGSVPRVDIEVTWMSREGRKKTLLSDVDVAIQAGRWIRVSADATPAR